MNFFDKLLIKSKLFYQCFYHFCYLIFHIINSFFLLLNHTCVTIFKIWKFIYKYYNIQIFYSPHTKNSGSTTTFNRSYDEKYRLCLRIVLHNSFLVCVYIYICVCVKYICVCVNVNSYQNKFLRKNGNYICIHQIDLCIHSIYASTYKFKHFTK